MSEPLTNRKFAVGQVLRPSRFYSSSPYLVYSAGVECDLLSMISAGVKEVSLKELLDGSKERTHKNGIGVVVGDWSENEIQKGFYKRGDKKGQAKPSKVVITSRSATAGDFLESSANGFSRADIKVDCEFRFINPGMDKKGLISGTTAATYSNDRHKWTFHLDFDDNGLLDMVIEGKRNDKDYLCNFLIDNVPFIKAVRNTSSGINLLGEADPCTLGVSQKVWEEFTRAVFATCLLLPGHPVLDVSGSINTVCNHINGLKFWSDEMKRPEGMWLTEKDGRIVDCPAGEGLHVLNDLNDDKWAFFHWPEKEGATDESVKAATQRLLSLIPELFQKADFSKLLGSLENMGRGKEKVSNISVYRRIAECKNSEEYLKAVLEKREVKKAPKEKDESEDPLALKSSWGVSGVDRNTVFHDFFKTAVSAHCKAKSFQEFRDKMEPYYAEKMKKTVHGGVLGVDWKNIEGMLTYQWKHIQPNLNYTARKRNAAKRCKAKLQALNLCRNKVRPGSELERFFVRIGYDDSVTCLGFSTEVRENLNKRMVREKVKQLGNNGGWITGQYELKKGHTKARCGKFTEEDFKHVVHMKENTGHDGIGQFDPLRILIPADHKIDLTSFKKKDLALIEKLKNLAPGEYDNKAIAKLVSSILKDGLDVSMEYGFEKYSLAFQDMLDSWNSDKWMESPVGTSDNLMDDGMHLRNKWRNEQEVRSQEVKREEVSHVKACMTQNNYETIYFCATVGSSNIRVEEAPATQQAQQTLRTKNNGDKGPPDVIEGYSSYEEWYVNL